MAIVIPAPTSDLRLSVVNQRQLSIIFFGTPSTAVPVLRALHQDGWPVSAVVTAPDAPQGRRMVLTPSPVRIAAEDLRIQVFTPRTLKDDSFWNDFDALKPDLCVVAAYGKLIPERFLTIPRLGFINIHPSLLPAYRGPSPVQSAILDGCASTGVTLIRLDADMDHGPVLAEVPWVIPGGFDAALCEDELFSVGARLLTDTLPGYIDGTVIARPQNHELATYSKKFVRADGRIDWTRPADEVVNRIRALNANPGTWTMWKQRTLNIHNAHRVDAPVPMHPAGTTMLVGTFLAVACSEGAVAVEVLQLEGSTRQNARDFLNGHSSFVGDMLV